MPTKYDVFAEVIEKAPCKPRDLPFKVPIYSHLKSLIGMGWIEESHGVYAPRKNSNTIPAFNIIKYCLKNGLDHNVFFSRNAFEILIELFRSAPCLRPDAVKGNRDSLEFINYLEENQFILLAQKIPVKGIILQHRVFDYLASLNKKNFSFKTSDYLDLKDAALRLKESINPFDDSIFSYLSGSAGLEGSTVTPGETRELILKDIYPEKPQKDIQMIKNLNEALRYIFEHLHEEITEDHIKNLNGRVMFSFHRYAGSYKKTQNKIHGNPDFKTAAPNDVPARMKIYVEFLKTIDSRERCLANIGKIHNDIQRIHPFPDGNSRTTRMLVNWVLLRFGFPLLVIKMGCFDEYMSLSKLAKKRDDTRLTKLFQHLLVHESLMKYKN